MVLVDPVALAQALIRCPSVTPDDAGAQDILEEALKALGFACHRLVFDEDGTEAVNNLYARIGNGRPHFCFAGHTDVVPPGDAKLWCRPPFAADIDHHVLYGRGAADMKSAIAAFAAAASRHLRKGRFTGSISFLITGDEEGIGVNGTRKLLDWLKARGETIDHCVVGEPTSVAKTGDTLKIGRRGSINVGMTVRGVQGHVGYPSRANNPVPPLAALITRLAGHTLDTGTAQFEPSTLAFTSADVGNAATNVIPGEARARFNIRFNDAHTPESLIAWIVREADEVAKASGCEIAIESAVSGTSFVTEPGPFTDLVVDAVRRVTGARPQFSTGGGTSDARFIKDFCPVVELGLVGTTMHKTDECVALADIETLTEIYTGLLSAYFSNPPA